MTNNVTFKKIYKLFRSGFILLCLIGISFTLYSCSNIPDLPHYKKSPAKQNFKYESNTPFSQYVTDTRSHLEENRVFFDTTNQKEELNLVAPFEWEIPSSCNSEKKRGILMVHGLSDTAYVMRDLAKELNKKCILVRAILLPGHGTRPKDLSDIKYTEWIDAVNYGINSLKKDVNQVYIAGFSLGGLLTANALLDHQDLKGAILIAPALGINQPLITWNTTWLRHVIEWINVDPSTQAPRYQSMPTNGIAQTYLFSTYFNNRLEMKKSINTPVLLIQSMEDVAVQPELNLTLFKQHMTHPKSKALVYKGEAISVEPFPALELVSSFLPTKKIINLSHLSLPYAPANKTYGANGSYKACGQHVGIVPAKQAEDCLNGNDNWMGEFGTEAKRYPFQRLTYNPLFDSMVERIDSYLKSL